MEQLFPVYQAEIKRSKVYNIPELAFPAGKGARPFVYFNMVSSADGRAINSEGNAGGLGSSTDHYLMSRLRAAAEGVLIGAETFRRDLFLPIIRPQLAEKRERHFPGAPQPWAIVLSSDGNLPLEKKFFAADSPLNGRRLIVLGSRATITVEERLRQVAEVVRVPDDENKRPNLAWLLAYLYKELGITKLLCEGGPSLNYSFLTHKLGDEFFWTLAPKMLGTQTSGILNGTPQGFPGELQPQLQLVSLYKNENELFFRYRINYTK
jgi:2,5-diamino-6-(ribosylamino)-4(3H)-pyrimidinone 5'-phosphate reductase